MTTKKTTKKATVDPVEVTKGIEEMVDANRKTLQDAFAFGTEAAEKAFKTNTETLKTNYEKAVAEGKSGFEKAVKTFEGSQFYDKDNAEAFVKASNAAVEKGEKIGSAMIDFGTDRMQEVFNVTRSIAETEDVTKVVEIQTEFAKTSMQTYVSEVGKINTMVVDATKSVLEPFGAQYAANLDMFTKQA
ncbi:MAG: phasin family protein [Proteobacteria bacterium]|nr:phasin family protein [Pseudomonadota bacterium]